MIVKLQTQFGADSGLAADLCTITPHFIASQVLGGVDADQLCQDLAEALSTWAGNREVTVTAYDAQGTKPVYPIGRFVSHGGVHPASQCPREVALCLSYYSEHNVPRKRGRLYIPQCVTGGSAGVRPNGGQIDKIMSVAPILAALGGPNITWAVFSRSNNAAYPVTNYWVDDEWDTIRSRGMRPSTRSSATTSG